MIELPEDDIGQEHVVLQNDGLLARLKKLDPSVDIKKVESILDEIDFKDIYICEIVIKESLKALDRSNVGNYLPFLKAIEKLSGKTQREKFYDALEKNFELYLDNYPGIPPGTTIH